MERSKRKSRKKRGRLNAFDVVATVNFCDLSLGFRKKEGSRGNTENEEGTTLEQKWRWTKEPRERVYIFSQKKEESTMRKQNAFTTTRLLLLLGSLCLVLVLLLALLLWWLKNELRCTSIDTVSSSFPGLSFERKRGKLQLCALGDFRDTGKEDLRKQRPRSYGKLAKVAMVPK